MPKALPDIDEIVSTFQFFDNWEDRYRFLIELGEQLPVLDPKYQTEEHRVVGCVSKVWIVARPGPAPDTLLFQGDSDAATVKGLVAVLISLYSGKSRPQIRDLDADQVFEKLRLYDHLSPTRHVGVYAMVEKIKAIAQNSATNTDKVANQKVTQDTVSSHPT